MTEKHLIFISYASPDEELAQFIGDQIEAVLGKDRVEAFVSPKIDAGDTWFPTIQNALDRCEALVVLVTPASIDRRWVWFEIGYFWAKTKGAERHIYPLALSHGQEIPHPLNEHQAEFLDKQEDIVDFFESLCKQFGFGSPENANVEKLVETACNSPEYPHQENLSEQEIRTLLSNYLKNEFDPFNTDKWLIRYAEWDDYLNVPRGSSAKYLKDVVVQNNEFRVDSETDNTVTISGTKFRGYL